MLNVTIKNEVLNKKTQFPKAFAYSLDLMK